MTNEQAANPFNCYDFADNSAPVLNHATAAQYVRDFFASCCRDGISANVGNDKPFITSVEVNADGAFDVHFGLNNTRGDECMTVWLEKRRDGTSYLYGEW